MALATYDYSNGKESRNQQATVWIGGLEAQCTEELVWELMCQAGPVASVNMPRDKITQLHNGYAFCEFVDSDTADYAVRITNMLKLYGKQLRVNKAAVDQKDQPEQGFSANLFIGNLDPDVDEKMLYDTFSRFGAVLSAKVMVDPETGQPRGFGFVSFDSFESADAAIEGMSGQFLANRAIHSSYAYKKDGTKGERHGSEAERLLAKESTVRNIRPRAISMMTGSMGGFPTMGQPVGMGRPPPLPMNIMNMGQNVPMGGMGLARGLPPMPPMPPPGLPPQQFRPPPLPSSDGRFPFPPSAPFGQMPQMPGGMMPPMRPGMPPNFPPPWMQMRPPPMMPGGGPPPFMPPFRPPPLPELRPNMQGMPPNMPPHFFGMGPPPNMPGPPPGMPPQMQQN